MAFGRIGVGVEQIGANRPLEEERLLRHERHGPPQVGQLEVADVPAVKADSSPGFAAGVGSLGDVVKPRGEGQQGRLARAAFAEHAHAHSRLDTERHAVEHVGAVRRIRKRDTAVLEGPARADDRDGTFAVADRLGLVEDLEEPFHRDLGRQGGRLKLRQPHDRLIELAHQGIDRQQLADGQSPRPTRTMP